MTDGERLVLEERLLDAQDLLPKYYSAYGQAQAELLDRQDALTELLAELKRLREALGHD